MTKVQTVVGQIDSSEMGICLTHEHILNDVKSWWCRTQQPGIDPDEFRDTPVSMEILWELRQDPFGNIDNLGMNDLEVAAQELERFSSFGGVTVLEATSVSIGRDLPGLREISKKTGLNIIAGTGLYLDASMTEEQRNMSVNQIFDLIQEDLAQGSGGCLPGFIGEIGVSSDFTEAEKRSLRAASRVQVTSGLPMQVHLPGWFRIAHEVLDVCQDEGVDLRNVVLCHMGPSGEDTEYQQSVAARGAWIQFDMIGMEVFYADQGVQCPSDEDNARYLMSLVNRGFADRLLVSQDIFLKSLLRRFGGPGYGHILQYFAPRLFRHGATPDLLEQLTIHNPKKLFDHAKGE